MPLRKFAFKLALKLGRTVSELESSMSYKEFLEWMIFYTIEPWGSEVEDIRNALLSSTVANGSLLVADPKALKSKAFKLEDFRINKIYDTEQKKTIERETGLKDSLFKRMTQANHKFDQKANK